MIDYQTPLGQLSLAGRCELGDGTPLPAAEARRLACEAQIIPVVMGGSSLPLDVGRSSRLATGAQRAAARAVHDTCCIDGCDTPFDYCELHHIRWWGSGGRSDLANLAPVCSKHHHLIHDHGWELRLDPDRVGTLHRSEPTAGGSDRTAGAKVSPTMWPGHDEQRPDPSTLEDRLRDAAPPPPPDPSRSRSAPPPRVPRERSRRMRATAIPPDAAMAPDRC